MNYTSRFRLLKPEVNDYYSIDDFNANADIIDAALSNDGRTVIAQRERDPTLPSYGMDASVVLRAAPYTGAAEITLQSGATALRRRKHECKAARGPERDNYH